MECSINNVAVLCVCVVHHSSIIDCYIKVFSVTLLIVILKCLCTIAVARYKKLIKGSDYFLIRVILLYRTFCANTMQPTALS